MCLILKHTTPLVAREDMVVYKVLNKDLTSPVMGFQYELGRVYKEPLSDNYISYNSLGEAYIGKYWFHSYDTHIISNIEELIIVKCIIPKGTKYFLGHGAQICSKSIKIVEVL